MLNALRNKLIDILTSRLTLFTIAFLVIGGVLIYRCFDLQIVQGEKYLEEFVLSTEKTRDIPSSRGKIYDRNGNLLAYNELAYSVKIEDTFDSGSQKNKKLNQTISDLLQLLHKNNELISSDFKIVLDENDSFVFTVSGTQLLRFLADVYGHTTIDKLTEKERNSTALDIMEFLSRKSGTGFAIGDFDEPDDTSSDFIAGKGYKNSEWLELVSTRYALKLISYRKYIGTIVSTNVSEKTVAAIMENSTELPGVSIVEDTVRRYVDSKYFSHVLGYTGKVSAEELESLNEQMLNGGGGEAVYNINSVVGKGGIEAYLETTLQGVKGYEKVVVDNMGKVISIVEREEAEAGQDVYLTIDANLTKAIYNILEQKLAGLISSKLINAKEYYPPENAKNSDIKIPIYDVYYAMFDNAILNISHFESKNAGEVEQKIYLEHESYCEKVYSKLRNELMTTKTTYRRLPKEYQAYQSLIVSLLRSNGIILTKLVDDKDPVQIQWTTEETISLHDYLKYCISQNWIDVSKLNIDDKYSDSNEIFAQIVEKIISLLDKNKNFQTLLYKYMLHAGSISGKQVCMALCEQGIINIPSEDETALYKGKMSAYQFMKNRIDQIDITPAQLALDPCNGSVVVTDVNNGDVLALVTYPGYDNNKMANTVDPTYYAMLNNDKSMPQYNFATQSSMAPGSTFKMVVATAGLMEGIITTKSTEFCTGLFTEITPSPKCWQTWGHGSENVVTAIRDSCNQYFYNVGYSLATRNGIYDAQAGLDTLYYYADLFGLTSKSGIEISESAPTVSTQDPVRSAIGQGSNSYTTVGLARYVATVANGGTCMDLTLLDKLTDSEGNVVKEFETKVRNVIDMPQSYWDAIHTGMRMVVEGKSYFKDLAVSVAGKTGTAEQIKNRANHALFVGYAPYEEPEIAIATRIPYGYSSDYAAQTTKDILKYYYRLEAEEDLITGEADAPEGGISNEL